jgi:hypothetical protein
MKLLDLVSQSSLIEFTSYLKLAAAKESSWLSLIYAMAAVSMCPTSHQHSATIGRRKIIAVFIQYIIYGISTSRVDL